MSDGTYQHEWPEEISRLFNGGVMTKASLDKANAWTIEQLHCGGPADYNRFERGAWVESMKMLERRIQQGYKSIGQSDEDAAREIKVYNEKKGNKFLPIRKFHDGGDKEFSGPPQTLEQLVLVQCGEDSDEWDNFQRLKGLFGVSKPLEVVDGD